MSTKSEVRSDDQLWDQCEAQHQGYYEAPWQACLDAQFDGVDFGRIERLQRLVRRVQRNICAPHSTERMEQLVALEQRLYYAVGDCL